LIVISGKKTNISRRYQYPEFRAKMIFLDAFLRAKELSTKKWMKKFV